MSYSAITSPDIYSAAYSAVPLRVTSTDTNILENYKYVTNIIWNKSSVTTMSSYSIGNIVYSNCLTTEAHNLSVGDVILLNDSDNANYFTGYWIVRKVTSTTSFVIDLPFEFSPTNPMVASKVIKYLMPPDLDGDAKLDLSNTLKNFVTQNLIDSNDIYEGSETKFEFDLLMGGEYTYVFPFTEISSSVDSTVTLINSGMTAITDQEFQVGDIINIQQDLFEWEYYDNFFTAGFVGFIGNTNLFPSVSNGTPIQVTGQITNPNYNGPTTVSSIAFDELSIVTPKGFESPTPPEGGIIYLTPRPEYNTTGTITDIQYTAGTGVIITTDIALVGSTVSLAGTATPVSSVLTLNPNQLSLSGFSVYNARVETPVYTIDGFDKYVCQFRSSTANNISTILGNDDKYTIEASTKSWLLAHDGYDGTPMSPRFTFYDTNGTQISQMVYNNPSEYGPTVVINSWADNGGKLRINCSTAHNLQVGDTLEIFQATAAYLGVTTVLSVQSTTSLTVNVTWTTNGLLGAENLKKVTSIGYRDFYFPIGINQLIANSDYTVNIGSDLVTIADDVDYYSVSMERLGSVASNLIWFELNDECSNYDLLHLMWKDGKGSWLSMPFNQKSRNNLEVERKNYYKSTGKWDDSTFGYDSHGRGDKTYYSRSRESVIVNSGWLKDYDNLLIKDLFKSANVNVQLTDGTLVAGVIDNTSIELIKSDNLEMIQYQFTVNYSRNDYRF